MLLTYKSLGLSPPNEAARYQVPISFFAHGNFNLHLCSVPITTRLQALLIWECAANLLSGQQDQSKMSAAVAQSSKPTT